MTILLFKNLTTPFPVSFKERKNVVKYQMKWMLSILFIVFQFNFSIAQPSQIKRTWHWYFGNQAGIDFSNGNAVADTNGALVTSEGCASISDTSGNLQFYSDGRNVWNRNHQVMPNGSGIMGGATGSSSQQALIIPKPFSPNIYYLFTTDETQNFGVNGMRFTIIDMNLDGSLGDVDIGQKNILLFAPCTEKLAAVNHCNDSSVWIMGHETNNNVFRAYLLTANGIDTNAVLSTVGTPMTNGDWYGQMKFSPNGKMLCTGMSDKLNRCEIYQFDNYSGLLKNPIIILDTITPFNAASMNNGISFSPDNSKLYVGQTYTIRLLQFDVSIYDSSLIVDSKQLIYSNSNVGFACRVLQNASDNKMYYNQVNVLDTNLLCIQNPNLSGASCNFDSSGLSLLVKIARSGLPNFNESYFRTTPNSICSTSLLENNCSVIKVFPNPARDWIEVRGREIQQVQIFNVLTNLSIDLRAGDSSSLIINTSHLARGIYFILIKTNSKVFSQKIILI